ncbi:MAG: hypothetical protein R3E86_04565 [Pseudomonadales bacterium]
MSKLLTICLLLLSSTAAGAAEVAGEPLGEAPVRVRHDVAQSGEEIVTLRYWRIKKGTFPQFLEASEQGVWPFFEKIGARVVGMWQVVHPDDVGDTATAASPDYDEVWLMTRYASVEHWRATRRMAELGGNGPDYDKAMAALRLRRSLTLETDLRFLQGSTWQSPPQYLPNVD